ncbi:MAG: N-acetyltransferase [Verrucomicrobiota bacterium]|nr:N-acetyltransferase [Verrucomicrobiota bacterium]
MPTIRPARIEDAPAIFSLLSPLAKDGIVLSRTVEDIICYIDNFFIAYWDGSIVGCVALRDFGNGLEEIRSLVVDDKYRGDGFGSKLVRETCKLAKKRNTKRLFALTLEENFFIKNGFHVVDKSIFPQKIWSDCIKCPKKDCCDEIAVTREL